MWFLEFLFYLQEHIAPAALGIIDGEVKPDHKRMKMMEVGSYAGESTLLFSSTGLFDEVISFIFIFLNAFSIISMLETCVHTPSYYILKIMFDV